MAWNPSPKVAAARDIGKTFNKTIVVVLMLTDDTIEYASYGETPKLCRDARKIADVAYNAVSDFVGAVMCSADNDDEDGFQPCADCDGHDACRDFGCAIKLGLGHMVQTPL